MKDWRRKQAAAAIKAREKAELERLRIALEHAKAQRRARVRAVRALCKRGKETLRVKLKERRRLERERLRREAEAARQAERSACRARRAIAGRQGAAAVAGASRALSEARSAQKLQARQAARRLRSTVTERRQESDDEAERDLPAELHGAWRKLRNRFKGSAKMSRAEAFMHWAHENPGEVVALQASEADAEVARLIREHAAQQKQHRMRKTHAQIDAELRRAGVPF